jgi:hypothetical protein
MIHHLYSPPSKKVKFEQIKTKSIIRNPGNNQADANANSLLESGKSFSGYKLPNPKLLGRHAKDSGATFDDIHRGGSETPVSIGNSHGRFSPSYLTKVFQDKQNSEVKPKNLPSISGHLYSLSTAEDWSAENKPSEILKKKLESMISKQKSEKNMKKENKEIITVKLLNQVMKKKCPSSHPPTILESESSRIQ